MDYRNLELLAQKEWGHLNPKLLKAWIESSLAMNSSNTVCLPCHSWAIVFFKKWALLQGESKHMRLYSWQVSFSCTVTDSWGEEGQRNGTQIFTSLWSSNGRRAPCLLLWAKTTRVRLSLQWESTSLSQMLSPAPRAAVWPLWSLWSCDWPSVPVCLSVHVRDSALVLWCRWWALKQWEEWFLTASVFCASPWLCLSNLWPPPEPQLSSAAQHCQEALPSGNSESPFQSLASYILFISPRAHLKDYLSCIIPTEFSC